MSQTEHLDLSRIIEERDLECIETESDPELQEAVYCSITAYRRPDQLAVGDPMPSLELVTLAGNETKILATNDGRPTVLFFGSYT